MKVSKNFYYKYILLILMIFLFIVILFFTHILSNVLVPLFVAIFSAMFLYPFIKNLHNTKIPNWLSTLIVVMIFLLIISSLLTLLIFSFSFFLKDLNKNISAIRLRTEEVIKELSKNEYLRNIMMRLKIREDQVISELLRLVKDTLTINNFKDYIIIPAAKTIDLLKSFGLYVLALIFVLPGIGKITEKITRAFPDENGKKINEIITNVTDSIQNYMVAKSIISFGVGLISFLICLFFGIKYALLWGFIIFLFNYIPIIGSIIAVIFPIFQAISQSFLDGFPIIKILILAILLISAQIVMGNIIEPKFMSRGVNLSPLVIFTSLLIWGYIWGVVGVILSVPIMSAINIVCRNIEPLKPLSILISAKPKKIKKEKNKKDEKTATVA